MGNGTDLHAWFAIRRELAPRARNVLGAGSFLVPVLLWCVVSYVPWIWHPMVRVTDPGAVDYFQTDMLVDRAVYADELAGMQAQGKALPQGEPANPIYLPAPHQVAQAFYSAFRTAPETRDGKWLHQSLWHSITIIFWGFALSSLIGVPLGILCGTYSAVARLNEPFVEFFRYLPAP